MARVGFEGETLVDVLRHRAAASGDAEHLVLLDDDGRSSPLSFAELEAGAERVAGELVSQGIEPADTVALMLPTGRDFYFSFAGVLLAGAVPVPIYPPVKIDQIEEYAERQVGILRNAEAKALVTPRQATKLARLLRPRVPSMRAIVRPDRAVAKGSMGANLEARCPGARDLGLIQYTSGSTGDPKGVELTHANLLANIRSIGEAVELTDDDVVVSWLPLYHDMGLIGCWLSSLCFGLKMISFSPLAFLRQPKRWLRAMSDFGGTLAAAPNFAYELCLRRIRDRDLEGLDLSKWRWALNGAEPVNPETIERFAERFAAVGFREGTMAPVYGLAENAVALTFPPLGRPPLIEAVEREALEVEGRAVPADKSAEGALLNVSVGSPIPRTELRVVDSSGRAVRERREGEIQFRGPSATRGYYRNPKATAAIRTADGWTRTGDRGYLAGGELFITGRLKDLIIKGGRNLDPAEVEVAAARVDGIRRGCVAAVGVPNPATASEDLVVIAETRARDAEARRRLAAEVRREVRSAIALAPDKVVLVPPRTVPKTPSGKLRRAETRQRHLSNSLVQRRPPAWVQVARLAAGASWLGLMAYLWRRRSRRKGTDESSQE